jgi:hypothetical protein
MKSPRISAFNIHEWIYEKLHLPEEDLNMIQIDGKNGTYTSNLRTQNECNKY